MKIVKLRKIWFIFSGLLVAGSIFSLLIFGLNLGIDFRGGSILEVEFIKERPAVEDLNKTLEQGGFQNVFLQPSDEKKLLLRTRELKEQEHQQMLQVLAGDEIIEEVFMELRFDSIGPTIGAELRRKSFYAIGLVLLMILIFITWSFRKVSRPVSSWKFGAVALVALAHDVIIPTGVFSLLGVWYGVEADTLFVTALLTILGFSVHDTIVVFDRIRENLRRIGTSSSFEEIVGRSLNETFGRSLATSFALFLVIGALFLFGGSSTKYFTLTLLVGVVAGTYSSLFLASPLLVVWEKWKKRS